MGRVGGDETAFPHRSRPFVLNAIGMWDFRDPRDTHLTWVKDTWGALQGVGAGEPYLNFLADDKGSDVRAAYGRDTLRRLVELKDRYDPVNVFHVNQNVRPSRFGSTLPSDEISHERRAGLRPRSRRWRRGRGTPGVTVLAAPASWGVRPRTH